jgi:3-phosphoinositide dependent protein kinase-1
LDNRPATASVDLWALGCILYQILEGEPPFTAPSDYLLFRQIEVRCRSQRRPVHTVLPVG